MGEYSVIYELVSSILCRFQQVNIRKNITRNNDVKLCRALVDQQWRCVCNDHTVMLRNIRRGEWFYIRSYSDFRKAC